MRRSLPALVLLPAFVARPEPPPPIPPLARVAAVELPLRVLDIGLPEASAGFRWEAESIGRLLLELESHLVEIEGLIPRIGDAGPAPSLADAPLTGITPWLGQMQSTGESSAWRVTLTACPPQDACALFETTGSKSDPEAMGLSLAVDVADWLARPLGNVQPNGISADDYAALIQGRGAATLYGVLPPVDPERVGNHRRDPIARGVLIDPSVTAAWWVYGRHLLKYGEPEQALSAFTRAEGVGTAEYDRAIALAASERWRDARDVWSTVAAEPRFAISAASAAIQSEDVVSAEAWLGILPYQDERDPALLALLVRQAGPDVEEDLLIEWSGVADENPRPVELHIEWLVRNEQYERARELTEELARRGEVLRASSLEYALSVELGDQVPRSTPARTPKNADERLTLASDAAEQGNTARAMDLVNAVLREDRWSPEALALLVDLQLAQGETAAARETYQRLLTVDPTWGREVPPWR